VAVVDRRIEGSGRGNGRGMPESLGSDGEAGLFADAREDVRQVVLREAGKPIRRRSCAGIDILFVL